MCRGCLNCLNSREENRDKHIHKVAIFLWCCSGGKVVWWGNVVNVIHQQLKRQWIMKIWRDIRLSFKYNIIWKLAFCVNWCPHSFCSSRDRRLFYLEISPSRVSLFNVWLHLLDLQPETQQYNISASRPDCDVSGKRLLCEYGLLTDSLAIRWQSDVFFVHDCM